MLFGTSFLSVGDKPPDARAPRRDSSWVGAHREAVRCPRSRCGRINRSAHQRHPVHGGESLLGRPGRAFSQQGSLPVWCLLLAVRGRHDGRDGPTCYNRLYVPALDAPRGCRYAGEGLRCVQSYMVHWLRAHGPRHADKLLRERLLLRVNGVVQSHVLPPPQADDHK